MAAQIAAEPLDDIEWHNAAADERVNHLNGSLHAQGGSPPSPWANATRRPGYRQ